MNKAKDVISLALGEVGYFEKKSNDQLVHKTANAGSGNFTKYARDIDGIPNLLNGKKQGAPWCAIFVLWLYVSLYGAEKAMKMLFLPEKSLAASCTYWMNYYKAAGRFFKDPMPGDQIFFGQGNTAEHTGSVEKIEDGRVYTIEGNTSTQDGVVSNGGGVFPKSYPLKHSRILGYGRPDYASEVCENPEEKDPETAETKREEFTLEMRVLKNGCKGDDVKALQILLIGNGCTCGSWGADGNFGAATEAAVRNYQKTNKLQVDGKAGPETMSHLLGVS